MSTVGSSSELEGEGPWQGPERARFFRTFHGGPVLPRILEYDVIEADDREHLQREVQEALADGWQPWGGVAMNNGGYAQAIVRYAE